MLFSIKYLKSYWFGLIANLILVTSFGYIHTHAVRTGDFDSLLTFFTTFYCFFWFLFLERTNIKYLHLFFIGLTLAILTKSIQALLFIPALTIYLLFYKKTLEVLKNKWFYIDMLICIVLVLAFYLLREYYNPGFLKAVWENEIGGRYFITSEGHEHPFIFYLDQLINLHYTKWYWLFPLGLIIGIFEKNNSLKRITIFSSLLAISYLLLISISKTKTEWYDVPLFPFLAMVGGIAIFWLFSFLQNSIYLNKHLRINFIPFIFLLIVFFYPYKKIIDKVYFPKETDKEQEEYRISYFLKEAVKSERSIKQEFICYNEHTAHLAFYTIQLNKMGQQVGFKDWRKLTSGETVIASQYDVQQYIEKNYSCDVIDKYFNVKTYKIKSNP